MKCVHSRHAAAAGGYQPVIEALLRAGSRADARDASGRTPLFSCHAGACAERLLSAGADVDATDTIGRTTLHDLAVALRP